MLAPAVPYLYLYVFIHFCLKLSAISFALKTKQLKSGETLRLRCSVRTPRNPDEILWSVPGNISEKRFEVTSFKILEGQMWSLRKNIKVADVTAQDTGYYTCSHVIRKQTPNAMTLPDTHVWVKRIYVYVYGKFKSNLHYARDITPKRVTSGGIYLRGLVPEQRNSYIKSTSACSKFTKLSREACMPTAGLL